MGGVALYHGRPVTVIGTRKGKTLEENLKCNFGMPNPEGYRKALRLMRQAEKFRRPILTFIDTSAASIPLVISELHDLGKVGPGSRVLVVGFGGGLTWGGALVEFA